MFKLFSKTKRYFRGIENEHLMNNFFYKMLKLNNHNHFMSRVLLEYFIEAVDSKESVKDVFQVLVKGKEKVRVAEELEDILSLKSVLLNKQFRHWNNKKIYTTKGIALPIVGIIFEDFEEVFHTEESMKIPIYNTFYHKYHNHNDEVLVIYTDGEETYARPYEMFFGLVEDEGLVKPRFEKIVE